MVYGRKQRVRRYRRRMSAKRIFSNRSSKAQANQIYTLNRRINRINRSLRPETKVYISAASQRTFASDDIGNVYGEYVFPEIQQGTGENNRIGDKINVKTWSIRTYFEYYNTSDTGYHNSESAGCSWRFICLQPKNSVPRSGVQITDLIHNASNTGANYTMMSVAPLVNGITTDYHILMDTHGVITSDSNQRMLKFNVRGVRPIRWASDGTSNLPFYVIVVSGLHYDVNFTEYVQVTSLQKLAYTDA